MKRLSLPGTASAVVVLLFTHASTLVAASIPDTPENRLQQAERYLQATPPKAMFDDMAAKMAMNVPPAEREKFRQFFSSALDIAALEKAMREAIVRHFTAEEIAALADFYASPVGKSAMGKFGAYMSELMPVIQAEVMKAQAKIQRSQPGN